MGMADNIIIRSFESGEETEVSRLIVDNLILVNVIDYGEAAVNQLAIFYTPEWILRYAQSCEMLVALAGAEIVGTIALDHERVRSLFVRIDHQRQGIGKRLMRFIEEAARRQDMKQLNLLANVGAVEFYRKLGFVPREKREIEVGEARLLVACMEKALEKA